MPTLVELMIEAVRLAGDDAGAGRAARPHRVDRCAEGRVDPSRPRSRGGRRVRVAGRAHRAGRGGGAAAGGDRRRRAAPSIAGAGVALGRRRRGGARLDRRRRRLGGRPPARPSPSPTSTSVSHDLGVSPLEVANALVRPADRLRGARVGVGRTHAGGSRAEHRRRLGALWAGFAAVAATNPVAWRTDGPDAAAIVDPSPDNRMVASPYTKLCCSNLRVNQAAALVVTTVGHRSGPRHPQRPLGVPARRRGVQPRRAGRAAARPGPLAGRRLGERRALEIAGARRRRPRPGRPLQLLPRRGAAWPRTSSGSRSTGRSRSPAA